MATQQPEVHQKSLADLVADAAGGLGGRTLAEALSDVTRTLAEQARFDEPTELLRTALPLCGDPRLSHNVIGKVPPKIFNHILEQPGVRPEVLTDLWQEHNVNQAIEDAAIVPGRLAHTVRVYTWWNAWKPSPTAFRSTTSSACTC